MSGVAADRDGQPMARPRRKQAELPRICLHLAARRAGCRRRRPTVKARAASDVAMPVPSALTSASFSVQRSKKRSRWASGSSCLRCAASAGAKNRAAMSASVHVAIDALDVDADVDSGGHRAGHHAVRVRQAERRADRALIDQERLAVRGLVESPALRRAVAVARQGGAQQRVRGGVVARVVGEPKAAVLRPLLVREHRCGGGDRRFVECAGGLKPDVDVVRRHERMLLSFRWLAGREGRVRAVGFSRVEDLDVQCQRLDEGRQLRL